jgi:DNA modification methylase
MWEVLGHRVICADALDVGTLPALMGAERAMMTFADPPYNVVVQGNVAGRGKVKYTEFAQASGEMTPAEFVAFLMSAFAQIAAYSAPGALAYCCMDWRHLLEVMAAGRRAFADLKNVCVWAKPHPGQGSFYRSQHEMILVFEAVAGARRNNIQLGRFGRNRSNLWTYPSPSAFGRAGEEGRLTLDHPTPKPVQMVADAILDCTARGDIVLDPFLGGGGTLIAAERVGRRCRGVEIEPKYVDAALRRLRRLTGEDAVRVSDGRRFADLEQEANDGGG